MSNLTGSDSAINSGIGTAQSGTDNPPTTSPNVLDIPAVLTGIATDNDSVISSDDSEANSSGTVVPQTSQVTTLGFCHSCNKQAQIDLRAYTCIECHGGFIELLANSNESIEGHYPSANEANANGSSDARVRPIDRLIDSRPIEISDEDEDLGAPNPTPFFVINSHDNSSDQSAPGGSTTNTTPNNNNNSALNGDSFSTVTTPLFQLIRRLNSRRARVANIISSQLQQEMSGSSPSTAGSGSSATTADRLPADVITLGDEPLRSTPQSHDESTTREMSDALNTGVLFNPFNSFSRARANSFHYRLRRHAPNASASVAASVSREPASAHQEPRPFARYRSRFVHRGPAQASRFHFNFLDDDELLNDHGAIIITTLINQLRNTNRGAAPASDAQIKSLPLVDMDREHIDKVSQCAVCMEDFSLLERVKQLPCNHLYHDLCIDQWLKLHATCPVCRKNINADEASAEQEQPTLESTRPTLLNIFPFSATTTTTTTTANSASNPPDTATLSSATATADPLLVSAAQSALNHSTRRQALRNRQLYRVHIRQSSRDSNYPSLQSSSGSTDPSTAYVDSPPVDEYDDPGYFDTHNTLRRDRLYYDTLASSMSIQERQPGVRATAVLINPRWNRSSMQTTNLPGIEESEPAPSETVANEPSSLSAFSLMSNYRNFRSSQAPSSASSNPVSGGSRISQMVDRLLNHYRTTRFSNGSAHRSSPYGSIDSQNPSHRQSQSSITNNNRFYYRSNPTQRSQTESERPSNNAANGPSISLRLGQLFRSNRHRNPDLNTGPTPSNQNTNSNSSNSQSNEATAERGANTVTSATQGNTSTNNDFYEIIQLEPSSPDHGLERTSFGPGNRSSLRIPSSHRLRREDHVSLRDNESFTDNPNNYFDFSLFNRSQTLENNLLLDRLFDIPEDVQQMTSDELDEHILGLEEEDEEEEMEETSSNEMEETSSQEEDVPGLNANDPITITLDDSDFERQYSALTSSTSREQTRTLSEMEGNDLTNSSGVPQAKKRKTEST